ncbi:MAG TPA: coproporphyrinogen III oxidase [Cytophagales bacterium]|nr:coproporphyrinogen III oxidase [Cytophagales bacterium]
MAGIYIHIPFCKQACHYCDFHFSTQTDLREKMTESLLREMELQRLYLSGHTVETLYFGGGTPSLLSVAPLANLIAKANELFGIKPGGEVTLEANPDDLMPETLQGLKEAGINRLSIGVQSFDDGVLGWMNRGHTADQIFTSYRAARAIGFSVISIDLIYGIPNQADGYWANTVRQAIALDPEHISAYHLTIEDRTAFGSWKKRGKLVEATDEQAAWEFEHLMDRLEKAGYEHYEISNFARAGRYGLHNSNYWNGEHYLGIGPSAHSYNGISRQFNVANNHLYIKAIARHEIPAEREILTRENQVNEYLFTGLRTRWGCSLQKLNETWGYDLLAVPYAQQLLEQKLLVLEDDRLLLTRQGKFQADKIAADLFV